MNKKLIEGYDDYYITDGGIVLHGIRPLKIQINAKNVPIVRLFKDGKYATKSIAKLVADAFLDKPDDGAAYVVGYNDGNNHNFALSNLYWTTRSELYTKLYAEDNVYAIKRLNSVYVKLCKPVIAYRNKKDIKADYSEYPSISEAARSNCISIPSISRCLKNANYMCCGYYWMYKPEEFDNDKVTTSD